MVAITIVLLIVLVAGIALGAYAFLAPRRAEVQRVQRPVPDLHVNTDWTHEAGDEFAGLSESARCDLVFAVALLEDERSHKLLQHALADPAEAVALAAAHALASSGRRPIVEEYLAEHPGERADRIAGTLALLQ